MLRKWTISLLMLFCFVQYVSAQSKEKISCDPSSGGKKLSFDKSDMPFNATASDARDIDKRCPAEGNGSDAKQKGQEAQNRAKNNFGAKGQAIAISIADIDRLEKAALAARNCWAKHKSGCRRLELDPKSGLPIDRQQLVNITKNGQGMEIGEGTIVALEARVLDSHYSNTKYNLYKNKKTGDFDRGSGESVNCNCNAVDWNDLHVVLVSPGETDECMSVTAEISPHFRPDLWRRFHNMRKNQLGENINSEAKGVDFAKIQMVRFTGPLFYDASHEPCSPGNKRSPRRRSIWEIHPAYKIDVKVNGKWLSFSDWVSTQ